MTSLEPLFVKYLNNQCTPEEIDQLLHYFNITDNEAALRLLITEALQHPVQSTDAMQPVLDEAFHNINRQIKTVAFNRRRFMQVAAAVVLVVTGWLLIRINLDNRVAPPSLITLATTKGQRRQCTLADGTVIWLAPGTTLQYPAQFTGTLREVRLNGEAFFEVAHNAEHPFIVHTATLQTRVLGTSFSIQAYEHQPTVEVTLVTGKVSITNGKQQLPLAPNQRAVFHKATSRLSGNDYPDAAQMLARRAGLLQYKGAALLQVLGDLQMSYNVTIDVSPALQHCTYYGELDTKQPLPRLLQQIALTYNATIAGKEDRFTIINGSCNH